MTPISEDILKVLRTRIGLPETVTAQDNALTLVWQGVVQWAEDYLDRILVSGTYEEVFTHEGNTNYSLPGFPVVQVFEIRDEKGNDLSGQCHVARKSGLVMFERPCLAHEITVSYECDPPMTGPMFLALLNMFDIGWAVQSGEGLVDQVKSSAIDGMSVGYAVGGSTAGNPFNSAGIPDNIAAILAAYRRITC